RDAEPRALRNRRERAIGGRATDRNGAAGKEIGIEIAEMQVGVGYRRFAPAALVTRRPRHGARALRTDLDQTEVINARNGTAACADLDQFDGRNADRMTTARREPLLACRLEVVRN